MGSCDAKRRQTKWDPEGQVSWGVELWLSETEVQGKFTIGGRGRGFDLECVDVCHLRLSVGMLPRNIFNFKPSEMAANAFKTNMVWWNLYTFNNKKSRYKNIFSPQSRLCSFNRSFNILQATQRVGSSMSKLTGIGQLHDDVVLLQLSEPLVCCFLVQIRAIVL